MRGSGIGTVTVVEISRHVQVAGAIGGVLRRDGKADGVNGFPTDETKVKSNGKREKGREPLRRVSSRKRTLRCSCLVDREAVKVVLGAVVASP